MHGKEIIGRFIEVKSNNTNQTGESIAMAESIKLCFSNLLIT